MSQKQILRMLCGTSLALAAQPALAVDVDDFVRRIEASRSNLIYLGDARVAGDSVIVDGVSFRDGVSDILLDGQFTFAGITGQPDSGYRIDSIVAPKIVFRDQATDVAFATLKGLSLEGYVVPGESNPIIYPVHLHTERFTWLDSPLTMGGDRIRDRADNHQRYGCQRGDLDGHQWVDRRPAGRPAPIRWTW